MKRRVTIGLFAMLLAATPAAARDTSPFGPNVACDVFGSKADCVSPFATGIVDGQWIGLIFHFNGTNGGPDAIDVVAIGFGGNGLQTTNLPAIEPAGTFGDRMEAAFRSGKLIVSNASYLHGEAHCCFTHTTIRRFGFHHRRLVVEREVTVLNAATAAQRSAALDRAPQLVR